MKSHKTQHRLLVTSLTVFALVAITVPLLAQPTGLMRTVADGKPWLMTQSNGTTGQVTLTPDGKAVMQIGSRSISPSWRVSERGELCIKPAMIIPERCSILKRDGAAIIGFQNGEEQFRLTRP